MADYYSPTVVQPVIPLNDLTACEYLLLCGLFDHDTDAGKVYLFSETGIRDMPEFDTADVQAALAVDKGRDNQAARWFQDRLDHVGDAHDELILDMSTKSFEFLFQDILQRSATLNYVTVITSWTCSKMRPDAFGALATLITADRILSKSTDDLVNGFLDEVDPTGAWAERLS